MTSMPLLVIATTTVVVLADLTGKRTLAAKLEFDLPMKDSLIGELMKLHDRSADEWLSLSAQFHATHMTISGQYRIAISSRNMSVTAMEAEVGIERLRKIGVFEQSSNGIAAALETPLWEATDARVITDPRTAPAGVFGLEILQGKLALEGTSASATLEVGPFGYTSQKGWKQLDFIMWQAEGAGGLSVVGEFVQDRLTAPIPVLAILTSPFQIEGLNDQGQRVTSPSYAGSFLNPGEFHFVGFFSAFDRNLLLKSGTNGHGMITFHAPDDASIEITQGKGCRVEMSKARGEISDTYVLTNKRRLDALSDVTMMLESVESITIRYVMGERDVHVTTDIAGTARELTIDDLVLGRVTAAGFLRRVLSTLHFAISYAISIPTLLGLMLRRRTTARSRTRDLIEKAEVALRSLVCARIQSKFRENAEALVRRVVGDERWGRIVREREKTAATQKDAFGYCTIGELEQVVVQFWPLFRDVFHERREFDKLLSSLVRVRNNLSHARPVAHKDLARCRVACQDLIDMIGELPASVDARSPQARLQ